MLAPADLTRIDDGLWRWTAVHPEWTAGASPGSPSDWPAEVGSVACSTAGVLTVIDPLVPPEAQSLWKWLDEQAGAHGSVHVLTTIKWHRRSRDELVERYGAQVSRARDALPAGVESIPIDGAGETMFWLPVTRTLVPGDRLLGDDGGGLRLCPESWLSYLPSRIGLARLREALRPLLELDTRRVLVSHGDPVLRDGGGAIARALA